MHNVEALIARSDALAVAVRRFECAVPCPLVQGFSLLPLTDTLKGALAAERPETKALPADPLPNFSDGLHALALDLAQHVPVAYIATFYFGGQGGQHALVWDQGHLRCSPATAGYDQAWPNSPISQALRMIGVVAEQGEDEFDTVGLGQHRETHQWAESAT
jgi:hypothetical protein